MMTDNIGLLLVDVQQGFHDDYWGVRNNPQAEENIQAILKKFRDEQLPVFHAQHLSRKPNSPLHPSKPGVAFMPFAQPLASEPVFKKQVNSAFIGTTLESTLHEKNIKTIMIVGISTDHCVSTTTRMAANLGFNVYLIADATFTFSRAGHDGLNYPAETVHALALASLHDEFATVINTDTALSLFQA